MWCFSWSCHSKGGQYALSSQVVFSGKYWYYLFVI
ncbi:unnamed protein product [Dracunculus medinensis]|uniref:Uncharacterized protein n=1 Tax=Dracunculus medinensis TaxID=318479 RepID=A0A0N4U3E6_DRAME|nr:unnamed protein product [Dracunculus medinensis]